MKHSASISGTVELHQLVQLLYVLLGLCHWSEVFWVEGGLAAFTDTFLEVAFLNGAVLFFNVFLAKDQVFVIVVHFTNTYYTGS